MADEWVNVCDGDYSGASKLTFTASTSSHFAIPSILTGAVLTASYGIQEELTLSDLNSSNAPRRFFSKYFLNNGGQLVLTGYFLAGTSQDSKEAYRKAALCVTGRYFDSLVITSTASDGRSFTLIHPRAVSSQLSAGDIGGFPAHTGSITYSFTRIE